MNPKVLESERRICRLRGWEIVGYLREAIVPARSYTSPYQHDEFCEVIAFSVTIGERPQFKRVWFLRYEDGGYIDGYSWPLTISWGKPSGPAVQRVLTKSQMAEGAEYRDRCLHYWDAFRTLNNLPPRPRKKPGFLARLLGRSQ